MSIVSMLSLVYWVAAIVWHKQQDFKWLALESFVVVGVAAGVYLWWQGCWMRNESVEVERM